VCWCKAVALGRKSRMRRESHVRFREGAGVKFPACGQLLKGASGGALALTQSEWPKPHLSRAHLGPCQRAM